MAHIFINVSIGVNMGLSYAVFEEKYCCGRELQAGELEVLLADVWVPVYKQDFIVYHPLREVSIMLNTASIVCGSDDDFADKLEELSDEELILLNPMCGYSWTVCVEQKSPRTLRNLFGVMHRPITREERLFRKFFVDGSYGDDLIYSVLNSNEDFTKVHLESDNVDDGASFAKFLRRFDYFVQHLNENNMGTQGFTRTK